MIETSRLVEAMQMGLIQPGEGWFQHEDHPGYLVDRNGRVLSFQRRRPFFHKGGRMGAYPGIALRRADGSYRNWYRHRLVAEVFHGPCPAGMECRHLDGDRENCRAENLAWGTPLQNAEDKARHGTSSAGERNGQAKLTVTLVAEMRRIRAETGRSFKSIASEFSVSTMTAYRAVVAKSWRE